MARYKEKQRITLRIPIEDYTALIKYYGTISKAWKEGIEPSLKQLLNKKKTEKIQ